MQGSVFLFFAFQHSRIMRTRRKQMLLFGRHFNQLVVCQSCLLQFQARVILFQLNFPFLCLIQLDKMQRDWFCLNTTAKAETVTKTSNKIFNLPISNFQTACQQDYLLRQRLDAIPYSITENSPLLRSATRKTALRARGLASVSVESGLIALPTAFKGG